MKTAWILVPALVAGAAAVAQQIGLPSGLSITLYDVVVEEETGFARFRFLAPGIAGDGAPAYDALVPEFQWLCDTVVLPALTGQGWQGAQIIITLADREVAQGVSDPDAVQYFEGFSAGEGGCIWEPF